MAPTLAPPDEGRIKTLSACAVANFSQGHEPPSDKPSMQLRLAHGPRFGRGLVIALSGVDCAGKTTQRAGLVGVLRSLGSEPLTFWSRAGYTPGLKALEKALRRLRGRRGSPRSGVSSRPGGYPRRAASLRNPLVRWLWLRAALLDLWVSYGLRLRWWRATGRVVICDRYLLDCLVDFRVNFSAERVEELLLFRLLRRTAVRPDAAFCLLIPAELSARRASAKARRHWETLEVLRARRREYGRLCGELSVRALDGTREAGDLAVQLQREVLAVLQASALDLGRSH
jgi:thymidylate kinase